MTMLAPLETLEEVEEEEEGEGEGDGQEPASCMSWELIGGGGTGTELVPVNVDKSIRDSVGQK